MSLVISNELIQASGLSEEDLLLEIIILLFQKKKISIGKASKLAGLPLLKFQHELAVRQIPIHYDVEELEADLQALHLAEDSFEKPNGYFPVTQLGAVAGCLKYTGEPKKLSDFDAAIEQGVMEQWHDHSGY